MPLTGNLSFILRSASRLHVFATSGLRAIQANTGCSFSRLLSQGEQLPGLTHRLSPRFRVGFFLDGGNRQLAPNKEELR